MDNEKRHNAVKWKYTRPVFLEKGTGHGLKKRV
jgi:hypothetical protein